MQTAAREFSEAVDGLEAGAARGERGSQVALERCIEFEKLLARELPRFQRMAMRWLRNREDAEDAVQDAVMSAFVHIGSFEGRARMSSWLMSIVINSVKMHLRRNRRKFVPLDQVLEDDSRTLAELLPDPGPTPEQNCELSEVRAKVEQSIADLSPTQRAALQLCSRDGLSLKEAAAVLNVPIGTVKARLARGRGELTQRLRKVLVGSETRKPRIQSSMKQKVAQKPARCSQLKLTPSPSSCAPSRWPPRVEAEFARDAQIGADICFKLEVAVEGSPVPA